MEILSVVYLDAPYIKILIDKNCNSFNLGIDEKNK